MAFGVFEHVEMSGMCVALPTQRYDTKTVAKDMDERSLKRFIKSTGVEHRFIAKKGQLASDLCFSAADRLLTAFDVDRSEVDACLFITQTPDYQEPSTAIILQERLGLSKECIAFDVNLGCSAYVYGLYTMAGLIESGAIRKGLLLVGDVCFDQMKDQALFGDAGSATLLEYGSGKISGLLRSDGAGFQHIYVPYGGQRHPYDFEHPELLNEKQVMDGSAVFEFTIREVPKLLEDFNQMCGKSWDDYDAVVLHQANLMILKHIAKKLSIPMEKVPISIHKYGNVNGVTIPTTIVDMVQDTAPKREMSLMLSGFGVGLSWGAVSMKIDPGRVLPFIHTDHVWDENVKGEQ